MTRWVLAAVVIRLSCIGFRLVRSALSRVGPACASAQSYHVRKQLTRRLVRRNTSSALRWHRMQSRPPKRSKRRAKGRKSYWGWFHGDVTLGRSPAIRPSSARADFASILGSVEMSTMTATSGKAAGMTKDERFVILASSLGTVFEWYDFYLFGSLASIIGAQFFGVIDPATNQPMFNQATRDIFALLAFAAGFIVRPFGAIVFGRVGDIVGRKYTFLVTILIMGLSTFIVGILPNAATIGIAAPIILIGLRLLQGLALGGEYGGAATYVAEHSPAGKRGYYTSFIQTTATLGLFLSLLVILAATAYVNNNF